MKNTFGNAFSVTIFGESHGSAIGVVLDGLAPGISVSHETIEKYLSLRRPSGKISTKRVEPDEYSIVSGLFEGKTTGTALTILIPNTNKNSNAYNKDIPRPGHADYTAQCKYHGFQDYRGGGHFSGRITAGLVAAGAVVRPALEKKGIYIGTHIAELHGICDAPFGNLSENVRLLSDKPFPVLDDAQGACMLAVAEKAAQEGNSVGGVLETCILGMPEGVGEPWFDSVEGVLSHALFSIPAVKGIEFGEGFGFSKLFGTEANDEFFCENGKIKTCTNHNGGINGGITNGMPILFRTALKPTPSVYLPQKSVNMNTHADETLQITGRHDPAIIHRARAVVDAVCALVVYDLLSGRFGTDYFCPGQKT